MNLKDEYKVWLVNKGYKPKTINNNISNIVKIDDKYEVENNKTLSSQIKLINLFVYTKKDEANGKSNPTKIEIKGNIYNGLATYKKALIKFYEFYNEKNHKQAMFFGTKEEFEDLFHPSLAKIVQEMTKPYKKHLNNTCECCGKSCKQLESAHKEIKNYKGNERMYITYDIIEKYGQVNGAYSFDIYDFLFKFMLWHKDV